MTTGGAGVQTYFLYDGLGSVTDLTDDEGDAVDGYTYDVFGAIRSQSGSSDNYWLFTGEQYDARARHNAPGLYYLRARYYDPTIGRFLSQDPLLGRTRSPQTQNRFPYVANNPTNRLDPTGLRWFHGGEFGGGGKEGGGFDFDRLCPSRDPSYIYAIIGGVCYDITPPNHCGQMNGLLCGSGEKGLFGFQPEKPLSDALEWAWEHPECSGTSIIAAAYWVDAYFTFGATAPEAIRWSTAAGIGCAIAATED